jgi:type VI secretion system ImpA family protein
LGIWTRQPKEADWRRVFNLCSSALAERSKDLQLAIWRLEAAIQLDGFTGLLSGIAVVRELILGYWDSGLHPAPDEPHDWELRLGILEWLNDPLVRAVRQIVLARNPYTKREISCIHYLEALSVGSEKDWRCDGDVDEGKKTIYDRAVADGRVSMELWKETIRFAKLDHLSSILQVVEASRRELNEIERVVCDKAGDAAISFNLGREAIDDVARAINCFLTEDGQDTLGTPPTPSILLEETPPQPMGESTAPLSGTGIESNDFADDWARAEDLIRTGSVQQGINEMARLAASAPSGRDFFIRKLMLAERCLSSGSNQLAILIFEELGEQIEAFKLDQWESSSLVGRVWGGLCQCYKRLDPQVADVDKVARAYARFCRLNPWEAYSIGASAQNKQTGDGPTRR